MKVNWKIRFKNKAWLSAFISALVVILYTVIDMLGIIPNMPESMFIRLVDAVLMILSLIGVIMDPTTAGLDDSIRAQRYNKPWDDTLKDGGNG